MTDTPLTVSRKGRELTITGPFKLVKEHNGIPRWILKLQVGPMADPSIDCEALRTEPTCNNVIGIAVFDFEHENTARLVEAGLIDGGYADLVLTLESTYSQGGEKYLNSFPTPTSAAGRAQAAHRQDCSAIHECDECGGSGFYQGFAKTEPCSEGCKAP